jgi:hypothetical protein
MNEQHNELMKYVLDEPEEAAFEIAQLRRDARDQLERTTLIALITFVAGLILGLML